MNSRPDETQPTDGKTDAMNTQSGTRVLRERAFFYLLVLILILIMLFMLWPFLSPILLALAAIVILKPLYEWFLPKRGVSEKPMRATAVTIVTALLVVVIPVTLFLSAALSQATLFFNNLTWPEDGLVLDGVISNVEALINQVRSGEGVELDAGAFREWLSSGISSITGWVGEALISLGEAIPRFLVNSIIVLVIVMVMLPRYQSPDRDTLEKLIPFPEPITRLYLDKIQMMIVAMFRGTFVIAFAQGAAMGIVFWIVGVPNLMFLTLASMVLSILPVIGVALTAWPVAIILFLNGDVWQGVFVIASLVLVVGNIDAVLRPMLVPKGAYLNPALVVLSVFGGLQLMGVVGAIYGPVIMILLVTSTEVYTKYILRSDLEPYLDKEGTLDLEKLGLQPDLDTPDDQRSSVISVVNGLVGRLLAQTEPIDQHDP